MLAKLPKQNFMYLHTYIHGHLVQTERKRETEVGVSVYIKIKISERCPSDGLTAFAPVSSVSVFFPPDFRINNECLDECTEKYLTTNIDREKIFLQ